MPIESERAQILAMIANGTISAAEGAALLEALEESVEAATPPEAAASPPITEARSNFSAEIPDDFGGDPAEVLEPDEIYHPDPPPSPPDPADMKKWKRWWVIPMWVGVGVMLLGSALMYAAFANSGIGFWFACAWFPFMLGVLVMALAWSSRTAPWLHVRVHQRPGETPQKIAISFPLPIRLANWGLRNFGHYIPNLEGINLEGVMSALDESANDGTPFFIDVDGDNGEHVQIFIG